MAGIYIHIPFCKQLCNYCDFYKSISFAYKDDVIKALGKEILLQKKYLDNDLIETIYVGGGTPSVLSAEELERFLFVIYKNFHVAKNPEITIEVNPDDLSGQYLRDLKKTGFNRLSIGIQSFFNDDLKLMNRRHSTDQTIDAVMMAKDNGFDNISVDLIYGLPGMSIKKWEQNLNILFNINIEHISAYHLTIEAKTVFEKWVKQKKIKLVDEDESVNQFKMLIERSKKAGFIHYEISNFGKAGFFSQHNTNYWKQKLYLGVGPSAHSYNLLSRQWNVSNNKKYLEAIRKDKIPFEIEYLGTKTKYNDYVLTSLRTMWGIDLEFIGKNFGKEYKNLCLQESIPYLKKNQLIHTNNILKLSDDGKFISDSIISNLLIV